jgi:hypothetical protein
MSEVLTPEEIANLNNGVTAAKDALEPKGEETTTSPAVQALLAKPGEPREVTLANGMKVTIAKPTRPVGIVIAKALGAHAGNFMLYTWYKAAAWVQVVNGLKIPVVPTKAADFENIYNMIGDDGMDDLVGETIKYEDEITSALKAGAAVKNS